MKKTGIALSLCTFLLIGCGTSAPVMSINQTVATQQAGDSMRTQIAIYEALQGRGWQLQSDDGQKIMARYNKQDRHVAVIQIDYSAYQYSIKHVSSQGLGYNVKRNSIHRNFNRWVKNLEMDINSKLSFMP